MAIGKRSRHAKHVGTIFTELETSCSNSVNSMSFIWKYHMREKREANVNATWRTLIRDRPRSDGV